MKKRIIAILLTVILLVSCLPLSASAIETSGKCGDNITWKLEAGTLTISGKGKMTDWRIESGKPVSTPGWIDGFAMRYPGQEDIPEDELPNPMYYVASPVDRVVISEGITNIGSVAFYGCALKEIYIPKTVTSIGQSAFKPADGNLADFCFAGKESKKMYPQITYTDSGMSTADTKVYYSGTEAQWKKIAGMDYSNQCLTYAKNITYNAKIPAIPAEKPATGFTDVKSSDYYAKAVEWAVENKITSGLSANKFGPNSPCNRAQAVTFLWRAAGKPEPTATENPFTDVKPSDYYYKAVLWAAENNITAGTSATKFSPEKVCNRGQIVTFQYRAAGKPSVSDIDMAFVDVAAEEYYNAAVRWAVANKITSGLGDGKFGPEDTCNRAQIVTFLYRNREN